MKKFCILLISIVSIVFSVAGQNAIRTALLRKDITEMQLDTTPTLLYQFYFGKLDSLNNDTLPMRYIAPNPYYYRLFTPLTFYRSPINQVTQLTWKYHEPDVMQKDTLLELPFDKQTFTQTKHIDKQVDRILLATYLKYPKLVVTTEDKIQSRKSFREDIGVKIPQKTSVLSLFKPDPVADDHPAEVDITIRKPNFWITGGNGYLQFTQNYISKNWYKGGESTNSLLGGLQFFANYNDREKIQFENLFEMKLGFNTISSDTLHEYKINTDLLRLYSKLGIQAISRWYYTFSAEFNTQFFNNYKANSKDVQSAFMSPANLILSLGLDYKQKTKKMNLSVFLSPLTYNFRYVSNSKVDGTVFGLKEGRNTLHNFGSKVQSTLSWMIIPSVIWDSRLYCFTNYEKVEAEWENTFNFVLNRYLSTKLFVHGRFDDGVKRIDGKSYFQLKELLSFGINYKW